MRAWYDSELLFVVVIRVLQQRDRRISPSIPATLSRIDDPTRISERYGVEYTEGTRHVVLFALNIR